MIGKEFAQVHPSYDGSMHLMLPCNCVDKLIRKGYGELHTMALKSMIPDTAVMVFAPRNDEEIETALKILLRHLNLHRGN